MPAASQSLGVLKTKTLDHLPATTIEPLVRAALLEDFGRAGVCVPKRHLVLIS